MNRKAQVQILSVVLMAGIVIALVSIAYLWGKPMIDKRTSISDYSLAENFVFELDKEIRNIANSGVGTATLEIPNGYMNVTGYGEDSPLNNSVVYEFTVSQPMVFESVIYLKSAEIGDVGTYGEAEPRVVTLVGKPFQGIYKMTLNVRYIELDSEDRGYIIALSPITTSGKKQVTLRFNRNELLDPPAAANGGPLMVTYIDIALS